MGFFNVLETFFFISLAITFVLIMMLVYHFKGRLVILEQKCDTMFEIMNNLIKEMKNIQTKVIQSQMQQAPHPPPGGFPLDMMSMFGGNRFTQLPTQFEEDYEDEDEDEDENEGENEFKKIVVSDTELDSDNDEEEDDEKVKVIHVDISEQEVTSEDLPDLEEVEPEESVEDTEDEKDSLDKPDYKKMDISYLRTLVITRGLASDTKRLKKADLVKLLSDE